MIFREKLAAYVTPMAALIGLMAVGALLPFFGQSFWLQRSEYWIFPLQTLVCGVILWWFWRAYDFGIPRQLAVGISIGVIVFGLWISPQAFFGFPARTEGFNPETFSEHPVFFWGTVLLRFVRLVVVVPLVEEIFWRGFLLRYLIDEKFDLVPFGTFSWLSFLVVACAFALSHSMPDWPAALVTGALYNWVAYRSRSLSTCVVTHALTNLLLGFWIMSTRQWGFW